MINVTITGADNAVNPLHLHALSQEFPFVEWAILFSEKHAGTPRYPSDAWIKEATEVAVGRKGWEPRFAAHVCGALARSIESCHGDLGWYAQWHRRFSRIQINGWTSPIVDSDVSRALRDNAHRYGAEAAFSRPLRYILQARTPEDIPAVTADAVRIGGQVLFDPSCGRGVDAAGGVVAAGPDIVFVTGVDLCMPETFGFAGGINPDNVEALLPVLPKKLGWIDMESGVRTNDCLDLDKVRAVLEVVDRYRKASL